MSSDNAFIKARKNASEDSLKLLNKNKKKMKCLMILIFRFLHLHQYQ